MLNCELPLPGLAARLHRRIAAPLRYILNGIEKIQRCIRRIGGDGKPRVRGIDCHMGRLGRADCSVEGSIGGSSKRMLDQLREILLLQVVLVQLDDQDTNRLHGGVRILRLRRDFQYRTDKCRLIFVESPGKENRLAVVAHRRDESNLGHKEFMQSIELGRPRYLLEPLVRGIERFEIRLGSVGCLPNVHRGDEPWVGCRFCPVGILLRDARLERCRRSLGVVLKSSR